MVRGGKFGPTLKALSAVLVVARWRVEQIDVSIRGGESRVYQSHLAIPWKISGTYRQVLVDLLEE